MRTFETKIFIGLTCLLTGCLDADVRRGDHALGAGEYQAAIAFYELARERLPEAEVPVTRLASAHRALATHHLEKDACAEGRTHFAEAEALTRPLLPDREAIHACLRRTNAPEADRVVALKAMVEAGDQRTSTLLSLLRGHLSLGEDEAAVALRPTLIERHGITPEDQRQLAMAFIRLQRLQDARADLEVAVTHHPEDALLRLKLGELYEQSQDLPRAEQVYRDLTRDFPRNPLIHQRLGACLHKQGKLQEAADAEAAVRRLRGQTAPPKRKLRPLRKSRR
ncbi:MAG: tetratricopeptide repeat protein [Bradymonadia bacterium]